MFKIKASLLLLSLSVLYTVVVSASPDFQTCLWNVRNGTTLKGAVDSYGKQVTNLTSATGLTHHRCQSDCGSDPVAFDWHTFSQQFTAWLLPWLALISQLPYGAGDRLNDFLTVVLTVGSPTLAAYSLALAVTSNRLMVKRFGRITSQKAFLAARALGNLQQVSLQIPVKEDVLPKQNLEWWQELNHGLEYPVPKWTLSSIMSIVYVVVADLFTWIDTLAGPLAVAAVNATGESISSLWLCFLPIVIGNLQISPKCDCERISTAFSKANKFFHDEGVPERADCNYVSIQEPRDTIDEDENCSAPVFYYARVSQWLKTTHQVTGAFHCPTSQGGLNSGGSLGNGTGVKKDERFGSSYDTFAVFIVSACLAILLQWGTTGAAVVAMYYTPAKGFGCRSGAYLLYGFFSTTVWLLCVISSVLSQNYKTSTSKKGYIWWASVGLRLTAKFIAALNAILLFMTALFQFSNIDNNCWCNSSIISLHSKAYVVIEYTDDVSISVKHYWVVGLAMSVAAAGIFLLAINLLRKHPKLRRAYWMDEARMSYTSHRGSDQQAPTVVIANDIEMTPRSL